MSKKNKKIKNRPSETTTTDNNASTPTRKPSKEPEYSEKLENKSKDKNNYLGPLPLTLFLLAFFLSSCLTKLSKVNLLDYLLLRFSGQWYRYSTKKSYEYFFNNYDTNYTMQVLGASEEAYQNRVFNNDLTISKAAARFHEILDPDFIKLPQPGVSVPINNKIDLESKAKGFLVPVLFFDMGPNNLYRMMRQGIVNAYTLNYTIGIPVFHRHPRMGDVAEHPFNLPIYDNDYTVDLVWSADDTIDTYSLSRVMPTTDMLGFKKYCNNKLDIFIKCGERVDENRREAGMDYFFQAAQMQTSLDTVKVIYIDKIDDLSKAVQSEYLNYCVGIAYGRRCFPSQERWLSRYSKLADNILRPSYVRLLTEKFIDQILGGSNDLATKPFNTNFLAVHWRFDSDWLDMCKPTRAKGARDRNASICRLVMGLSYDQNIRNLFIKNLKRLQQKYQITKIYVASPPNNLELIKMLSLSFPGQIYFLEDLKKFADNLVYPQYLDNNYIASFIEQEICFRSKFFLGAPLSSWTQSVIVDRVARDNWNHESSLAALTEGAPLPPPPGYPPLIFQFPEGDFQYNFKKEVNPNVEKFK